MLQGLMEVVIEGALQAIGWGVMKAVTLGRYRGFRPEDILFEGAVGLATVFAIGYAAYRWLF